MYNMINMFSRYIKKSKSLISLSLIFLIISIAFFPAVGWVCNRSVNARQKISTNSYGDIEYWGVFIGIADYNGSDADLPIPEEVLKRIPHELSQYENWKEDHMKLLIDEEATSKNILESLDWLANVSDENDIVVFCYNGHGTEIPDDDGDEEDGMDEAIVAWELRIDGCITDDLLSEKFDKIYADGMAIFFDCCLSDELIGNKKRCARYFMNEIFSHEMRKDISIDGRVILTSAYGDGLSISMAIGGSPCSSFLAYAMNKSYRFYRDGILTAEETFGFAQFETDFFYLSEPFFSSFVFGIFGGLLSRLGGIILRDADFLDFIEGFIGGAILGFWYVILAYAILEITAYRDTGHWILPFPQLYDGYEGALILA